MPKLTAFEVHPRAAARREWTERAAGALRERRRRRLRDLVDRQRPIEDAVDLLRDEHRILRVPYIRLRPELLHADRDLLDHQVNPSLRPRPGEANPALAAHNRTSVRERPPLGRLAHRAGLAIPLELTALAVAHFRALDGESPTFEGINTVGRNSWATLVADRDIDAPSRARRHIVDALSRLSDERLVQLPRRRAAQQPWEGWALLREDGEGRHEYAVPASGFPIPVDFWLQGWVATLTAPELVAYLMIRYQAYRYSGAHAAAGVGVAPRVRRQQYGVTDGVYASLNELVEFGLLKRIHGDPGGQRSMREVSRYQLDDRRLAKPAYNTVTDVLSLYPTPARINRYDGEASLRPTPGSH